ncbi:PTS glucitol/sorbitol transporter subunit IIC [Lactobacillus sp. ESL0731]|uniref:PTS glucitol/sorbitol transporter subunit IIC n=1 Tax=unclassified Lactobacillus TaxID=2620435 RepID=UPI0023F89FC5|nr:MULTISPECIES: PTS glucitol/sorbitol transporter subunit IIC [unclassified Lactobacillus]WEV50404.1 PTS glucitol/sorbitol transporter subunit IIC [Lactobacillus sp. ESL0700]WEV61534.1 PTS glucitol/sorbitol transporter subunit IIC [Lactobacillus sp. ESL0731]
MTVLTKLAEGFIGIFRLGGKNLMGWISGTVPLVLMLMIAMNTLVTFMGKERVEKLAKVSSRNIFTRYLILPFISAFALSNPMAFTMNRFLPEFYKPSYYGVQSQVLQTNSGIFPHMNPGELFVWLGMAKGVEALGLNSTELAIRYMLVGFVLNLLDGCITDLTTAMVCKQQGIKLSKKVEDIAE